MDGMNKSGNDATVVDISAELSKLRIGEKLSKVDQDIIKGKGVVKSSSKNHSPILLEELKDVGITRIKESSVHFPNAVLYCHVCDYHCDNVPICWKHAKGNKHRKAVEAINLRSTLSVLPPPNLAHEEEITKLITKVANENGMTDSRKKECEDLHQYIEEEIKKKIPDISILVNGSCLSGFALKDSGLNLDLFLPNDKLKEIVFILEKIFKILCSNKKFRNNKKDLAAYHPQLCCTHVKSGIKVTIGPNYVSEMNTNEILRHYSMLDSRFKILAIAFRYWAKLCQIDDSSVGMLSPRCFPLMAIYFLQRCEDPVLPCLHKDRNDESYTKPDEFEVKWKSLNEASVGRLWIELFRFYASGRIFKDYSIDITSPHYLSRGFRRFKLLITEPLAKNENSGKKSILSQHPNFDTFTFIHDAMQNTLFHFLVPQLSYGSLFQAVTRKEKLSTIAMDENRLKKTSNPNDEETTAGESQETKILIDCKSDNYYSNVLWTKPSFTDDGIDPFSTFEYKSSLKTVKLDLALKLMSSVRKKDLFLKFEAKFFTKCQTVPSRCSICHESGHKMATCSVFKLPRLCKLPDSYHPRYKNALSSALITLKDYYQPKKREVTQRKSILERLQQFISELYPEAVLLTFGSSSNGFAFVGSDIDICLVFNDNPTGKGIDEIHIIKNLASKLKYGINHEWKIKDILAITTAKVPIVKFYLPKCNLDVDISLYNILALRNTKLLNTYSRIDVRVQIIGYGLKLWAKLCTIGDASKGSLSSYAYILLVIHYLQNCSPPVLPVLQELYDEKKKPENIVEGWNTWFYDDFTNLPSVWKGYGKNTMSSSQLWIGMFRYYTEKFDWELNVVSIKQASPLSRIEKMWNTQNIAIEDPFNIEHNLGAGLSRKMSTYIRKCFIRAREIFGSYAVNIDYTEVHNIIEIAFNQTILMYGKPPNDRGCRFCGRIGHNVKVCPKKQQKEERNKENNKLQAKIQKAPAAVGHPITKKQKGSLIVGPIATELNKPVIVLPNWITRNELIVDQPIVNATETEADSSMIHQGTATSAVTPNKPSEYTASEFFKMIPKGSSIPQIPRLTDLQRPIKKSDAPPPGFMSPCSPSHIKNNLTLHNDYSPNVLRTQQEIFNGPSIYEIEIYQNSPKITDFYRMDPTDGSIPPRQSLNADKILYDRHFKTVYESKANIGRYRYDIDKQMCIDSANRSTPSLQNWNSQLPTNSSNVEPPSRCSRNEPQAIPLDVTHRQIPGSMSSSHQPLDFRTRPSEAMNRTFPVVVTSSSPVNRCEPLRSLEIWNSNQPRHSYNIGYINSAINEHQSIPCSQIPVSIPNSQLTFGFQNRQSEAMSRTLPVTFTNSSLVNRIEPSLQIWNSFNVGSPINYIRSERQSISFDITNRQIPVSIPNSQVSHDLQSSQSEAISRTLPMGLTGSSLDDRSKLDDRDVRTDELNKQFQLEVSNRQYEAEETPPVVFSNLVNRSAIPFNENRNPINADHFSNRATGAAIHSMYSVNPSASYNASNADSTTFGSLNFEQFQVQKPQNNRHDTKGELYLKGRPFHQ